MRAIVTAAALLACNAAQAADAVHGEALARQWCAGCHTVGAAEAPTRDVPPSFASIARRPVATEDALRAWLNAPHPNMPDFELSRANIADLAAYIRSLAPPAN
jgi:mono/diheme cytochrome c family protein